MLPFYHRALSRQGAVDEGTDCTCEVTAGLVGHRYCHVDGIDDETDYLECPAELLFLLEMQEAQFVVKLKELDLLQWKPGIVWFVEGQCRVHLVGPGIIHVVHEIWE